MRYRFIFALIFFLSCTAEHTGPQPIRVFAAASLTTVLPEIARKFEETTPGTRIEFNFAASSLLAKQIAYGAKADIYFSANTQWVEYLQKRDLLMSSKPILGNKLVIVTPVGHAKSITRIQDLTGDGVTKIALADWTHVPSGMYAKKALEAAGIWQQVKSKCLPALDVRAALTYVETGEADCGIVYRTDAMLSTGVEIAYPIPNADTPDIRYEAGLLHASTHPFAKQFYIFLGDSTAYNIFEKHGFIPIK